jgi:hypothetical protein
MPRHSVLLSWTLPSSLGRQPVRFSPGINNGMNLRVSGQGAEGDPGAARRGDFLVQVIFEDDDARPDHYLAYRYSNP